MRHTPYRRYRRKARFFAGEKVYDRRLGVGRMRRVGFLKPTWCLVQFRNSGTCSTLRRLRELRPVKEV